MLIYGLVVGGTPFLPLYPNEIQAKALGMAVDVFEPELVNESPQRILSEEPGELVCTQPFPSQPVTFFGAGGDEKYFNSYFSTLPGIWVQGDLIKISNSTGGIQMLGRSYVAIFIFEPIYPIQAEFGC